MRPRWGLSRGSCRLEHNQSHSLFLLLANRHRSPIPDQRNLSRAARGRPAQDGAAYLLSSSNGRSRLEPCAGSTQPSLTIRLLFAYTGSHAGRTRTWCPADSRLPDCCDPAPGRAYQTQPQAEVDHLRLGSACGVGVAGVARTPQHAVKLTACCPGDFDGWHGLL